MSPTQEPSQKPTRGKQSLGEKMAAGLQGRPAGRLRSLLGKESAPKPVAVPFADDAYEIQVSFIKPDPNQPRKVFDQDALKELADSIKENGVLQPITVYQSEEDPKTYYIINGERRWRAARLARITTVPAIVRSATLDKDRIEQQQLVENIQRADLQPVEAARALKHWMTTHKLSQRHAAHRLGKPKTWVAELLSILTLPDELLVRAQKKRFSKMALVELSEVKDPKERDRLFDRMLESSTPWKTIKQARNEKKAPERHLTYRRIFSVEGYPYSFTVSADTDPDEVDLRHVIEALTRLIVDLEQRAREEEKSGRSSTT